MQFLVLNTTIPLQDYLPVLVALLALFALLCLIDYQLIGEYKLYTAGHCPDVMMKTESFAKQFSFYS